MRVIFAGTPAFAASTLQALIESSHTVDLVLTQPDRPSGRGMRLQPSPVKQLALAHGLALAQPMGLRLDGRYADDAQSAQQAIVTAAADVMVVAAYGLILPQWVLDAPRLGCLNVHASLLPRWRGAAPIHRAIEAGDAITGITIMQMDAGLDTGDTLRVCRVPIDPRETTASLHDRLAGAGAALLIEALDAVAAGTSVAVPQAAAGVTYAHKIEKDEAPIDWTRDALLLDRQVRAFNPFPGATAQIALNGQIETIKIWDAQTFATDAGSIGTPGTVLAVSDAGIEVACGVGCLRLLALQRPGGKRLSVSDFLRGCPLSAQQHFVLPPQKGAS
jgi:methionyl-tRNA formyltransferase